MARSVEHGERWISVRFFFFFLHPSAERIHAMDSQLNIPQCCSGSFSLIYHRQKFGDADYPFPLKRMATHTVQTHPSKFSTPLAFFVVVFCVNRPSLHSNNCKRQIGDFSAALHNAAHHHHHHASKWRC
ncbi:hypothetical protein TcCL_NonESM02634 [Trypanosoma cruzi]|nr:hypothetical protein TcCL_NonESM02634 [Trypanosoma cruzi]